MARLIDYNTHRVPDHCPSGSHPLPGLPSVHSWVCRLQFPPWNDAHAALMWFSASPATKQHLWVPAACLQQTGWVCSSQEEKPSAKVVVKAVYCCHRPFKKNVCEPLFMFTGLSTKAHIFFVSKSTVPVQCFTLHRCQFHPGSCVWFLTPRVFFFFLPSWFWHLLCFPLLSVSPAPLPHPLQLWMAGWFAFFVH